MNRFFSYIYELNWRLIRLLDGSEKPLLPLLTIILWIPSALIGWLLIRSMELEPALMIFTCMPGLILSLLFSSNFIQEKFKQFESEKVKLAKEIDDKYKQLQNICYYKSRQTEEIKKLADYVFLPRLAKSFFLQVGVG